MLLNVIQLLKMSYKKLDFWIGLSVMMLLCMLNTALWALICRNADVSMQVADANAFILNSGSPLFEVLMMGYLFILLLPYVFSYRRDSRLQIKQVLQVRMGRSRYYAANAIVCFICTFTAMLIPLLLENFVNGLLFKNGAAYGYSYNSMADITGKNVIISTVRSAIPFLELYIASPMNYNVLYAFLFSGFCALLAVFVYSLSFYVKKYGVILLLPLFILSQLQGQVDTVIELKADCYVNVNMRDYICIGSYFGQSILYITLLCLVLLAVSVLLICRKCKGDELE